MLRILLLASLARQSAAQNENTTTTVAPTTTTVAPCTYSPAVNQTSAPCSTTQAVVVTTTVSSVVTTGGSTVTTSGSNSNATTGTTLQTSDDITVSMAAEFGAATQSSTCATGDGWKGTVYTKGLHDQTVTEAGNTIDTSLGTRGTSAQGSCDKDGKLRGGGSAKYAICMGRATCGGLDCGCELYHPSTGVQFTCLAAGTACNNEKTAHETAKQTAIGLRRNLQSAAVRSLSTKNTIDTSMTLVIKTGAVSSMSSVKTAVTTALPSQADFQTRVQAKIRGYTSSQLTGMKPPAGNTMTDSAMASAVANTTVTVTTNPKAAVTVGGATASAASAVLSVAAVFGALMA